MSQKEKIKEDIATYRACLLLVATSLFGVIGYAVINIEKLTIAQTILGVIISVILVACFALALKKIP